MPHLKLLVANLIWGGLPLYFYFFTNVSPLFMLSMQIITTWIVLSIFTKRETITKKKLLSYIPSALFLSANWGIYAITVQNGFVLEASYAYLIMPVLFLIVDSITNKSKTTFLVKACAIVAVSIIAIDAMMNEVLPISGLLIATAFTLYALWHRKKGFEPLSALKNETFLMMPLAFLFLLFEVNLEVSSTQVLLLPILGVLTCLPLVLFITGSKLVEFRYISLYQFVSPITGSILAIMLFNQTLSNGRMFIYASLICVLCLNIFLNRSKVEHEQRT
ncbi:hypothetical protein [Xenorhabdus lircayensis]|uniref:Uncharacterized protein n=1 Tax=Xenorhabdus lircayensis TaxID=2763499 RepID=A0ABS0U6U3_9GAMM|nr:hypothetical protein [Xenorhabdus lircayensis]MBI6549603.1 hypothetical protein [Xenorhabdus lircayensis]